MANPGHNEGFHVLDDFICDAIHDPSIPAANPANQGRNEGMAVIQEVVFDASQADATPPASETSQPPSRRRRLWLWFFAGFLAAFLGLLLAYPMPFFDGGSVRQTTLWQYYLLEIQLELNASGNLGPTSGDWAAMLTTAITHVMISIVAGGAALAIGWASQERSRVV